MTAIVIGMEAAGRTRQGIAPAQPCATRDSAQIEPTCVAGETHPHGIAGVRELVTVRIATLVAGERIVATIRCSKRPNSPASFQSAAVLIRSVIPAKLLPSGRWTAGSVLPFWRCFRPFILRAVKVARHLFPIGFHRALTVRQDTARKFANPRHFSTLSAGTTGLVAHSDGHRDSERKIGNVRKAGGEIRNVEC